MARVYTVSFADVAVAAAQDLVYLLCSSTVPIEIHEVGLAQKTLTSWEAKGLLFRRIPATVTASSGGAAATPRPHNPGDSAAVTGGRVNDTTPATSSGTIVNLKATTWNFLNDFYWSPAGADDRMIIAPSSAFTVNLVTAPSGSMTSSGWVTFAELT